MNILEDFRATYLSVGMWVEKTYDALEQFTEEEMRQRKRGVSKEVVEEILPIAAFLKYFEIPERRLRCQYAAGDHRLYDAQLQISGKEVEKGFLQGNYFLEVTVAMASDEYLRLEALERYGKVSTGDKLRRVGSRRKGNDKIISRPLAQDREIAVNETAYWIAERLGDKLTKSKKNQNSYPKPRILIISVKPRWPLRMYEWTTILENIQSKVDSTIFERIFIVDPWKNIVLETRAQKT